MEVMIPNKVAHFLWPTVYIGRDQRIATKQCHGMYQSHYRVCKILCVSFKPRIPTNGAV